MDAEEYSSLLRRQRNYCRRRSGHRSWNIYGIPLRYLVRQATRCRLDDRTVGRLERRAIKRYKSDAI